MSTLFARENEGINFSTPLLSLVKSREVKQLVVSSGRIIHRATIREKRSSDSFPGKVVILPRSSRRSKKTVKIMVNLEGTTKLYFVQGVEV